MISNSSVLWDFQLFFIVFCYVFSTISDLFGSVIQLPDIPFQDDITVVVFVFERSATAFFMPPAPAPISCAPLSREPVAVPVPERAPEMVLESANTPEIITLFGLKFSYNQPSNLEFVENYILGVLVILYLIRWSILNLFLSFFLSLG